MAKTLLLYWTDHEVSAFAATGGIGGWTIDLAERGPLADGATASDIAKAIRSLAGDHLGGKPTVVVLVGGPDVQYRLLSLPPAPLDDLVDMVGMQADGEFASHDEGCRVDFSLLSGGDTQPSEVLLARLGSSVNKEITETLDHLELEAAHVVPVGIASSWFAGRDNTGLSADNHLLVAPGLRLLDLALVHEGKLSLGRRIDFSDAAATSEVRRLITPIRRTMAAAAGQLPGESIRSLAWLGSLDRESIASLSSSLGIPVTNVDVEAAARTIATIAGGVTNCGQFAPHIGALASLLDSNLAIDFANPKKHKEVPSQRRTYILAGVAAAVCVLGPMWMFYNRVASINEQARLLEVEQTTIEQRAETLAPQVERAASIDSWRATDITWLDQLQTVSERIRPLPLDAKDYVEAQDAMAQQITFKRKPGDRAAGGEIQVVVTAREWSTFSEIESRLRDDTHTVMPTSADFDAQMAPYSWKSTAVIDVAPPGDLLEDSQ